VALATAQGWISPVFDVARQLLLVDLEEGCELRRHEAFLQERDIALRAQRVADLGADVLICAAISVPQEVLLEGADVRVLSRISGPTEGVLQAFAQGQLDNGLFRMPGCGARRAHCRRRGRPDGRGGTRPRKGRTAMQILVSAQGASLDSPVDPRFGRARYFIALDSETGNASTHDNTQNLHAAQGAGVQAARNAVELGAQVVITGNVGPKAFLVLDAAGIEVYAGASGSVREAAAQYAEGALERVQNATVEGHWI